MTSKTKHSISVKVKESNFNFFEEISLSSSDDEIEDSSEAESKARMMWNNLDLALKKTYLRSSRDDDSDSGKSKKIQKSKRSPSPVTKKIKKEIVENNVVLKNENDNEQLFQMEIQRLVASPAQYFFQPVCFICEIYAENRNVSRCNGVCKRYFHWDCLLSQIDDEQPEGKSTGKCTDCQANQYSCILCAKTAELSTLLRCQNPDCGRLYHRSCLDRDSYPGLEISDNSITSCPSHYCISCVREDVSHAQNHCKKLIECLRCPLSFHCNDLCMAAGAFELSLSHVICPRHFQSKLVKTSTFKPFHPTWCFKCFKPGVKLLCHFCPSSFHTECVDNLPDPKATDTKHYICSNCRNHRQPRYGEVSFVKVSQYRWWPCEIIHPRNAPMNILKLSRPDGTYPVLFLGSNEYQWVAKTRSIDYNTAQQSSIFRDCGGSNKMDREFTIGLKSATKINQVFVNILLMYVPLKSITAPTMTDEELYPYINVKEPQKTMKFKPIKANILVPPAKLPNRTPPSICDCVDSCQPSECRNYAKKIECQPQSCPTKTRCQNQQFTNYVNKNLAVFKTTNRGFGFKTMVAIKKNDFVIEYLGDLITKSESIIRIQNAKRCNMKDFYIIKLTPDLFIDAGPKGNLSRYINHSCDPNCYLEKWIVNGYPRIGVFALIDIEPDQELTFDYRISGVIMKEDIFCLCGSLQCTGFLGPIKSLPNSPVKPVPASRNSMTPLSVEIALENVSVKPDVESPTKPIELKTDLKIDEEMVFGDFVDIPVESAVATGCTERADSDGSKTVHENFCYRCFDGGELVLCDKASCPKTYHLTCLGLRTAPEGTWFCPWHFCDTCGSPSQLFCVQCPTSYCDIHIDDANIQPAKGADSRLSICRRHGQPDYADESKTLDRTSPNEQGSSSQ